MTDDALATNARATIDKLRADIAETERDIAFQETRLAILTDTLAMLTGAPAARAPRKRRAEAPTVVQNAQALPLIGDAA
jgi:hypothetical protein